MKKLIIIPFLFICLSLSATIWYVAPDGDDDGAGTIGDPWKTWGFAFNNTTDIQPGDTVYFRGGIYYKDWSIAAGGTEANANFHADTKSYQITVTGTADAYVYFLAYPGETPILDSDNIIPNTTLNYAIRGGADYTYFKGLQIRNVWSVEGGIGGASVQCIAWKAEGNQVTIDNCKIYNTHGIGVQLAGSADTMLVVNCDAWNHCDSFAISPQLPGNRGSGFTYLVNPTGYSAYFKFVHCRAWNCGDQGFSGGWIGHSEYDGCWSFNNGQLQGEGHGWKLGWAIADGTKCDIHNCIAAYNQWDGIRTNDAGKAYVRELNIYNNIAYGNGIVANAYGFAIFNTLCSEALELTRSFKNNISYDNNGRDLYVASGAYYTHSYNSWDTPPGVTVSEADFVSVDSTGITGARDADGHLPDLSGFLHIADGSDLIGAGIGVGLVYDADSNYVNDPPDLGPYAYDATPPVPPNLPEITTGSVTLITSISASVASNITSDGGGTISARGICWSTSANPTTSDRKTVYTGGEGESYVDRILPGMLQSNTVYHARAYVTNESGTSYGADVEFTTLERSVPLVGGAVLMNGSNVIIIN